MLALSETDLDRQRGAVLIRAGKGGRQREVAMDRWAWEQLDPIIAASPMQSSGSTRPRGERDRPAGGLPDAPL